jgi:UDP-glucose 4-epimerase
MDGRTGPEADACAADGSLAVLALRYLNPAGAHASGLIGERPRVTPTT